MTSRFVCLANSFKEGGRCLAGIELDNNNNPIEINGRPKWIRPICNTEHGEINTNLISHLTILDIIEINVIPIPEESGYQSENILFNEQSIKVIGRYSENSIQNLCDHRNVIFGNRGKAVAEDAIEDLTYSLMLIETNQFEVIERVYEDNPDRPQIRFVFSYNRNRYDLPITDPVFLYRYQTNPDILGGVKKVYLSLSLGICWNDWYYKLVAGIIPAQRDKYTEQSENFDDIPF